MHITVATLDGQHVLSVDVSNELDLASLKVLCEEELKIKASEMVLMHNGQPLTDDRRTLGHYNITNNDLLSCQRIRSGHTSSSGGVSSRRGTGSSGAQQQFDPSNPRQLFDMVRSNPELLAQLRQGNPPVGDAIASNNYDRFMQLLSQHLPGASHQTELDRLAMADPFDPNVQRRIEELLHMQNVQDNMEHALEHMPEVFGHVVMLYITCKVNGHHVKAFVDSGAQMTIMSQACAERCGIMRLVDRRWGGIAKGVGTQKIIGRIHLAQIEVEKAFFTTAFSVLEDQPMDMLLGLDVLKRHQCVIDLQKNILRIGSANIETRFLSENELPDHAKLSGPISMDEMTEHENRDLAQALARSAEDAGDNTSSSIPPPPTTATTTVSGSEQLAISSEYPEQSVTHITKHGFTQEQAVNELKLFQGDANKALTSLMTKSLSLPKRKR